jgi:hypothetical protein
VLRCVEGAVLEAVLACDREHATLKYLSLKLKLGTAGKAQARQPHKMLVVQGELTKFAIYNQWRMRDK